VLFIFSFS
jgi:PX domain-containing protein kinase-like protein